VQLVPWRRRSGVELKRADPSIGLEAYIGLLTQFSYNGVQYTLPGAQQEEIGPQFMTLSRAAYKANGVVFACMLTRMLLFSEARFQWQNLAGGRPSNLFGNADLGLLEHPWPNGQTGDLLTRAIQYADLGGNFYAAKRPNGRLFPMRPDWTTIIIGVNSDDPYELDQVGAWDVDSEPVGYAYTPGGIGSGRRPYVFDVEDVIHWAPIPDPEAQFRGMSWLTPIVREVMADKAATEHKLKFFENAATPNLLVKMNTDDIAKFQQWIEIFRENYEGAERAYRTLFLSQGHDATVIGADMHEIEFKATQGAGETRIAAAARVPPIIVGLSEGLAAATYSNYGMARRAFSDATMRPLWRSFCGAVETVMPVPGSSRLWYDDRDVAFLQEDQKDAAAIVNTKATAIKTLVDSGFEPESAVSAVDSLDLSGLVHSGLVSVQLQPPGATEPPAGGELSQNGNDPALTAGGT
jgi:hypothetical protein